MSYLALDLGAGSGRAIIGYFKDNRLHLEEIHRFANRTVKLNNTLYWDFLSLFDEIKKSIYFAIKKGYDVKGVGIDTWGVDFGLLDEAGNLLSNPVCYRDERTQGTAAEVFKTISKKELFQIAGIQLMEINTLFQLFSLKKSKDSTLKTAHHLLFTPDLINYFLTGKKVNEYTIASTSQLLHVNDKIWDNSLFEKLELPKTIMQNIVQPGEIIGLLKEDIATETGATKAKVFAVASHDTASAMAAIPTTGEGQAFLSSGTWSLLGMLSDKAILTDEALQNDFTNEGGGNDKILFMKNITGLWLLQRLVAEWEKEEMNCSFEYLLPQIHSAEPFRSIVNSDDTLFTNPASMREAISEYCKKSSQPIPNTVGEYVRCVMESLAIKYHFVMQQLQRCSGREINTLHIVGGGSRNNLLNQFIANALNMKVVTGLTEATAVGNIMQQAIADKQVPDWQAGHEIIRQSFEFTTYHPAETQEWSYMAEKVKHLFE